MLTCKRCNTPQSVVNFYKSNKSSCKTCLNTITRNHNRSVYKERYSARKIAYHLKERYGITQEIYNDMLKQQDGVCWICKRPPKSKRLAVDHDHATGKIRGLLCQPCNHLLLPLVREDSEVLKRAAQYLEHFK